MTRHPKRANKFGGEQFRPDRSTHIYIYINHFFVGTGELFLSRLGIQVVHLVCSILDQFCHCAKHMDQKSSKMISKTSMVWMASSDLKNICWVDPDENLLQSDDEPSSGLVPARPDAWEKPGAPGHSWSQLHNSI